MGRAGQFALGAAALAVTGLALGPTIQGLADRSARPWPSQRLADEPRSNAGEASLKETNPWIELPGAARRFVLKDNIFGREPSFYAVRRHVAGGGRLDQLAFGPLDETSPHLRLTFYLPLDEPVGNVSFWLEMARRAGEAGLALDRSPPVPEVLLTRLGAFEYGALKATGPHGPRDCLGFRRQSSPRSPSRSDDVSELVISGLACLGEGAADPAFAREALVCSLEAITLAGADEEAELRAFFEEASAPVCASGRSAQAAG